MAEKKSKTKADEKAGSEPERKDESLGAATRHIGPTLESEGIFTDVRGTQLPPFESSARGGSRGDYRGEKQIDSLEARSFGEDRSDQQNANLEDERLSFGVTKNAASADSDTALRNFPGNVESSPEALKTRLPGDTSSDPHTDVGPDNASTGQGRTDEAA
ncbi:MAG TPA: hypothetical protein VFW25_05330 [Silvibacterium sp.]|nr:hypothetical protein [Silvibacterium sp.]